MTNKESQTVEYKQSWRNDCLKAVSAFANQETHSLLKFSIMPDLLNPGAWNNKNCRKLHRTGLAGTGF